MHAVVVDVTINDRDAALSILRDRVVPMVAAAPGFVAAYWLDGGPGKGHSIAVFESEQAARAMADQARSPGNEVTMDKIEVREVMAHA